MHCDLYWPCDIPVRCSSDKKSGGMVLSLPRNCRYATPFHIVPLLALVAVQVAYSPVAKIQSLNPPMEWKSEGVMDGNRRSMMIWHE